MKRLPCCYEMLPVTAKLCPGYCQNSVGRYTWSLWDIINFVLCFFSLFQSNTLFKSTALLPQHFFACFHSKDVSFFSLFEVKIVLEDLFCCYHIHRYLWFLIILPFPFIIIIIFFIKVFWLALVRAPYKPENSCKLREGIVATSQDVWIISLSPFLCLSVST